MHFIQILLIIVAIFAYYAGIMLNAFATLLCSKHAGIIGSSLNVGNNLYLITHPFGTMIVPFS